MLPVLAITLEMAAIHLCCIPLKIPLFVRLLLSIIQLKLPENHIILDGGTVSLQLAQCIRTGMVQVQAVMQAVDDLWSSSANI
jgi:hypothetical protein